MNRPDPSSLLESSSLKTYFLRIYLPILNLLQDHLRQPFKHSLDICPQLGASCYERKIRFGRVGWRSSYIWFIAYNHNLSSLIRIIMNLTQPRVNSPQSIIIIKIINQHDPNSIFIVSSRNSPKRFLTGLNKKTYTVSQICTLIIFPPTLIFFVANYTPIVGLL